MLASAIQAGFGGRPELIVDALKEGPKAIVASALTVTVMDVLIRGADVVAEVVWQAGRGDAQQVLDGLAATLSRAGGLATTFLGPLALLFGMIGLLMTTVVLFMRSSLLYLVAAFAPIVWSSSVSPVMRGSGRRLVHVTVALVLAKPAITVTLVVGVEAAGQRRRPGAGGRASDGAAALGTLVTGFACFAIAGLSPWVVYRLLPSVEAGGGVVGDRRRLGTGRDDRRAGRADGEVARRHRRGVGGDPQPAVAVRTDRSSHGGAGERVGTAGGAGGSTPATSGADSRRPAPPTRSGRRCADRRRHVRRSPARREQSPAAGRAMTASEVPS